METSCHKRGLFERTKRICSHCGTGEAETEIHFLTGCPKYKDIREDFFLQKIQDFLTLPKYRPIQTLLGEESSTLEARHLYL